MTQSNTNSPDIAFPGLVDLAAERIGGTALAASDEFFGPKEALLRPGRGISIPGKYTDQGKWVDGWESRRMRTLGHDWCLIRLGLAGKICLLNIDTNHFLGNHPACASVEICQLTGEIPVEEMISERTAWRKILPRSPLRPGTMNIFPTVTHEQATHLRLNIYPDGGVARIRA